MGYTFDALSTWFSGLGVPGTLSALLSLFILFVAPFLLLIMPIAGFATYIERKIAAAMQRRVGPNQVGFAGILRFVVNMLFFWMPREKRIATFESISKWPGVGRLLEFTRRLGLGQVLADGLKLLTKEDIVPKESDPLLFRVAPYASVAGAFMAFVAVPFSMNFYMADLSIGVLYVAAASGLVIVGLMLGGWASNNKWSLLGGIRAVAQIVSYEIPAGLCLAAIVMWTGSMSLQGIIAAQYEPGILSLAGWNLFQSPFMPLLAAVFYIAGLAECNRTPFDLAEAESELVSGFNTELSGMRYGLFALCEYVDMFLIGILFAVLFLGGYQSPIGEEWIVTLHPALETVIHAVILLIKCAFSVALAMWIRWSLPRFRMDQVMELAWLKLVPLALFCLFGLAGTMLLLGHARTGPQLYGHVVIPQSIELDPTKWLISWVVIGGIFWALVKWVRSAQPRPQTA